MTYRPQSSFKSTASPRSALRWLLACALGLTLAGFALPTPAADDQPYVSLRIVSPEPDETVHDNRGRVRVIVDLWPPLRADQEDRLTLWLDGRATAQMDGMEHLLVNLDRGTHTVQVQVDARSGAMLIRSEPVVFHLYHASRFMPQRNH